MVSLPVRKDKLAEEFKRSMDASVLEKTADDISMVTTNGSSGCLHKPLIEELSDPVSETIYQVNNMCMRLGLLFLFLFIKHPHITR